MATKARSGGQILVDQLKIHGVDTVFGIPGESYLAVLDALHDANSIRFVICRQEGGAAMMADAYGKLTGRPGICMVTRGPGATNASAGVHVAFQDSTPLILFIGQVARDQMEREAFQEIDYRRMYGQMAKWVAEVEDPARLPEFVARAFHTATSGRQGPVVLALPEDMLTQIAQTADAQPYAPLQALPGASQMQELTGLLEGAQRPLVLVGGSGWTQAARENLARFAEKSGVPVAASFRTQDILDNRHASYIGDVGIGINPKLAQRVKESDLLLVLGARLGEMTTSGYTLIGIPEPQMKLVHVYPGAEELGRVYRPTLGIVSGMAGICAALASLPKPAGDRFKAWREAARADYLDWIKPTRNPGSVQMGEIVDWLRQRLPDDAVICNGAGNYTAWVHRFYRYRGWRTQLAPTSGSMGYGLPASVAAKIVHPERVAVCFAGDGCLQMTMQEFGTACQAGANIVLVVVNNGMYGTIRMHQEREYPARPVGTDLVNPDFVAWAQAYGAAGWRVERTEDFAPAFEAALQAKTPSVIEVRLDPEAINPRTTLSAIRQASRGAKNAG
ncbi:MAG: thiamine pyrophosphate-binding protein [Reyranellaceae bacterium]